MYIHSASTSFSGLGEVWTAVINGNNEWVAVGTTTPGLTYKQKFRDKAAMGPTWGLSSRLVSCSHIDYPFIHAYSAPIYPHSPTRPLMHACCSDVSAEGSHGSLLYVVLPPHLFCVEGLAVRGSLVLAERP